MKRHLQSVDRPIQKARGIKRNRANSASMAACDHLGGATFGANKLGVKLLGPLMAIERLALR